MLVSAHDIVAVAAEAGARLVLVSADRVPALADLAAEPPVLIDGHTDAGQPRWL